MSDYVKHLNFESDTFSDMKRDMNFVLQRLLGNMQEKGATEGSMTLKVDISLTNEYIPNYDPEVEGESRKISKPKFKHKVTSAVQIKDEKTGNLDTEMELTFDEESGEYVMQPVANTEQRTIFDKDFQDNMNSPEQEEEDKPAGIPQLPGPEEDNVIDGDYKEVEDSAGPEDADQEDEEIEDITDEIMKDMESGLEDEEDTDDYDYDDPEE
ncbi:Uncharacterised protein [uncultured Blautia sp.]|nr:hypothetical protein [uncultured Blautia sp.]VEJ94927.1 Uncharacterised protein [uncultured Blautia sp.]